jgi:PAP2 superfamily
VLWGLDAIDQCRAEAQATGLKNAVAIAGISRQLGGAIAGKMNEWLASHSVAATAAAWYYILLQGAVVGVVGLLLIWRRVPSLRLHRNALIACNAIALVAFWLYPVAPPRMLRDIPISSARSSTAAALGAAGRPAPGWGKREGAGRARKVTRHRHPSKVSGPRR